MAEVERTYMSHPETGGVAEVTQEAFDALWQHNGWVLTPHVDAAQVAHDQRVRQVSSTLGIEDLQSATKAVLTEVAGQLGRSVPAGANKQQLLEVIESPVSPEDGTTTTAQE